MSHHTNPGSDLIEKAARAMHPHGAWFRLSITEQDQARAAVRAALLAIIDDMLDKAWEAIHETDHPDLDPGQIWGLA